jgi:hypothetical protein
MRNTLYARAHNQKTKRAAGASTVRVCAGGQSVQKAARIHANSARRDLHVRVQDNTTHTIFRAQICQRGQIVHSDENRRS